MLYIPSYADSGRISRNDTATPVLQPVTARILALYRGMVV